MLPVLFKIGGFEVHTFGLVLIIAFLAAYLFGRSRASKFGLTKDQVADAFFWTLVLGVLGARVGFILQELPYYLQHPHELLSLRFQGLTSFGGLIAGFFALIWLAKRAKVSSRTLMDLAAAPLLLGHAIGRIGCLMNGCCYGGRCELPWGIHVDGQNGLFHPAQIYDSLMVLGGLGFLLLMERRGLKPGQSTALAVILYCLSRFIYEFWRAGTTAQVNAGFATSTYFDGLPLTEGQLMSLIVILIAGVAWIRLGRARASAHRRRSGAGVALSFASLLDSFRGMPVLVIGDLMLDEYHFGRATRISPEAPVMVIRHEETTHLPGGAANVALNISALGAAPTLVGVVGKDSAGGELDQCMRSSGLDNVRLIRSADRKTTRKMRIVADHSHQVLRMDTEEDRPVDAEAVTSIIEALKTEIARAKVVVVSDYLKGVLVPEITETIFDEAKKSGVPVVVNPKPRSLDQYRGAALVSLNRLEMAQAKGLFAGLSNEAAAESACELRSRLGFGSVLLTLGEAGMAAAGDETFWISAPKVEVYDTAGAGDTVIAAAALGMASCGFKKEIFELAAQAAACVVRHVGVATPSKSDLVAIRQL